MTPDTDVTPVAAGSITLWDREADVVIARAERPPRADLC
jgi:3-oxo-5alpha-steroid 4-dehydrogenase